MFKKEKNFGHTALGFRGVGTEEKVQNGPKTKLVAKGFQEEDKVQLDSPMAQRESFQMFILTAFNIQMEMLWLIKITTPFLQ